MGDEDERLMRILSELEDYHQEFDGAVRHLRHVCSSLLQTNTLSLHLSITTVGFFIACSGSQSIGQRLCIELEF